MPRDCDVIVVGSGAGGATFAYACAKAGKSVLLLERGGKYQMPTPVHDEQAMLIDKKPYDDRKVEVNGSAKHLYMGGVLGGGTSLYGAALMRPSRDDFHPGKHYSQFLPRAQWDWPITYETLAPHYDEAEKLFGVSGCKEDDFGPLQKSSNGFPQQPLPLHPINQRLMAANQRRGLHPFRLPLAIDPDSCLRCSACAGYVCPTGARRSSAHLVEQAAMEGLPLRVLTNVEVERLRLPQQGEADGVDVVDRTTGQRAHYRAGRYVLAAGAIGSPLILLRSGSDHPLVGRHYMAHLSPIVIGLFPHRTGGDESFIKQVGFSDYYFGTKQYTHKMGLIQSLPIPGPLLLAKAIAFLPRRLLEFVRQRMLPLAGIIEDLPNPANRVFWGPNGEPSLRYKYAPYDLERGQQLARMMAQILKKAGAMLCLSKSFPSDEHIAHQCGTLRFGTDPVHAILDANCRLHRHANVFVVDGSFLPTSLGVGPALTIIANALRVAAIVAREA